jgi:pyruvate-formate lyase-activating enzyme
MEFLRGNESMMLESSPERRTTRRFDMRLPAMVKIIDSKPAELRTETQNVSARGVFFYLDHAVEPGSHLEVTLTFPPHITLTDSVRIRFLAKVLRVDTAPISRVGVAAYIEEYEFLRSNPANPDLESSN